MIIGPVGVDLGRLTLEILDSENVDPALISKLSPYLEKTYFTEEEIAYYELNLLVLTTDEADSLTEAVLKYTLSEVRKKYNKNVGKLSEVRRKCW